jgi:AraC-like DNA-binding protein
MTHIFLPEILYVLDGCAEIFVDGAGISRRLEKGDMIFLPAGAYIACELSEGGSILALRIAGKFPECPVSGNYKKMEEEGAQGNEEDENSKYSDRIHVLAANRRVRNVMSEIVVSLEDGFVCRHFLQGEVNRLLFFINAYYSEEDRIKFFSHTLTPNIKFSEFVRMNHTKYRTIGDLCDAMGMNTQAFTNRFKKVFGMTPHKWMQREKARHIYLDICRSDMTFKEIAVKYEFPMSSNFFRFCKQTFGESPGNLRKRLRRDGNG